MRWTSYFVMMGLMAIIRPAAAQTLPSDQRNQFALKLFDALQQTPGNIVFSPFSVHTALAMTDLGAAGETRKQLSSALYGSDARPPAVKDPESVVAANSPLKLANALWMQNGVAIEPNYQASVKSLFDSELSQVDFETQPDQARNKINQWVAKKTNDKISNLFAPGSIKTSDRLILVNAIYFKAEWEHKFQVESTNDQPFKIDGKESDLKVPTMHTTQSSGYFENSDLQMVSLRYAGDDDLSMVIVLPRHVDGLPALEKSLTAEQIADWESQQRSHRVELSLPRWKSMSTFHLIPLLQSMGVVDAFSSHADFSGISRTPLVIGDVVHQAMIVVDEQGTEAAAATGVQMRVMAARAMPPVTMIVDHPFLYLIQRGKTILFVGRVDDPRG